MKLKYRGVAYEYNPTKVASIEGKVGGKYRILLANVLQIILHKVLLIARVKISRYRSTNNFS